MSSSQLIFMQGKEKALDALFDGNGTNPAFGYLAVGYADENGFVDPKIEEHNGNNKESNFQEIDGSQRIKLQHHNAEYDYDTGKVTVQYQAVLDTGNINNHNINQLAVINNAEESDTDTIYSATSFKTFYKTDQTSLTFIIGFQL